MPSDVRPYFVPSYEAVEWLPWMLVQGDTRIPLPNYIEGWEPGTDLQLSRELKVDVERLEAETQSSLSDLIINVSWQSSTTGMVDSMAPVAIGPECLTAIDVKLDGYKLAGNLSLYSRIVLAQRPKGSIPLGAPRIPGSVLVEDRQLLALEREVTMFPVQLVDFARTAYSPDASWHLDVDPDLEAPFMAGFLLQINRRDTELCEAISQQGLVGDYQRALNDELEAGVAALMIDLAVENRDDLLSNEWPSGSVGEVLRNTLTGSNLADVVAPSAQSRADFRTKVAGAVRRMGRGRMFR